MQMTALGLYLATHWVLVIVVVLAVVGLGAGAWFLKNWKLALAAIALAVVGFMYQGAVMHGINVQLEKDMAEQLDISNGRLATINTLTLKDAFQAKKDSDANEALERLASETPKNDGPCLDAASSHRVWSGRNAAITGETPVPASRIPNLLSRFKRNP
jgi:hypothetical protein